MAQQLQSGQGGSGWRDICWRWKLIKIRSRWSEEGNSIAREMEMSMYSLFGWAQHLIGSREPLHWIFNWWADALEFGTPSDIHILSHVWLCMQKTINAKRWQVNNKKECCFFFSPWAKNTMSLKTGGEPQHPFPSLVSACFFQDYLSWLYSQQ